MEREDAAGTAESGSPRDFPRGQGEKMEYFLLTETDIVQLFPERASILKYISVSAAVISRSDPMGFGGIGFLGEKVALFGKNASIKGEV